MLLRFTLIISYLYGLVECTSQDNAMCDLVAATNIHSVSSTYSNWVCSSGVMVGSCSTWSGLTCGGSGQVIGISLQVNSLSGMLLLEVLNWINPTVGTLPSTIVFYLS